MRLFKIIAITIFDSIIVTSLIRKHSGIAWSPCDSEASCLLHWVASCNLQFVSMRWWVSIRRRARPCGAVPCCVDVSRPQKLLAHSSSMSRLWSPLLLLHFLSPSCASMCRRARPCASSRVHAVQCAPVRLLVGPPHTSPLLKSTHMSSSCRNLQFASLF